MSQAKKLSGSLGGLDSSLTCTMMLVSLFQCRPDSCHEYLCDAGCQSPTRQHHHKRHADAGSSAEPHQSNWTVLGANIGGSTNSGEECSELGSFPQSHAVGRNFVWGHKCSFCAFLGSKSPGTLLRAATKLFPWFDWCVWISRWTQVGSVYIPEGRVPIATLRDALKEGSGQ